MRAHAVEGSNMSIYGACFQDRVSHETDSAGQTHSTRQHEPQTSPLLRVEVRFCRPPLPAGHPDHRTWVPGSCQSKGDALEPSRSQKTSSHVQALCKGKTGKVTTTDANGQRLWLAVTLHRCAAAWKLDRRTVPKQPSAPCPLIVKPASWQPSTTNHWWTTSIVSVQRAL